MVAQRINIIQMRSSSSTSVCAPPQATFAMLDFSGSCSTSFTSSVQPELLSSFCSRPSWPSRPRPTISSRPVSVSKAVCAPPQLMCFTLAFRFAIFLGRNWSDLSPWPSCPSLPKPQVYTSPYFVTTPEQLSPQEMSTTRSLINDSRRIGSLMPLSPPVPSCPQVLLPHTNTLPSSLSAMLKLIPEETLTIFSSESSTSSALILACPFAPLTAVSPSTNTLPCALTKVMQSFAQEACLTSLRSTLTGALLFSFFQDSLVPMVLNLSFFCYKPHTYAQPFSVMTHMCWQPQLTCTIFSLNSTYRGISTLRLGGLWPSRPFLFLPQVSSFPSCVMPADRDFFESMSTKLTFLII